MLSLYPVVLVKPTVAMGMKFTIEKKKNISGTKRKKIDSASVCDRKEIAQSLQNTRERLTYNLHCTLREFILVVEYLQFSHATVFTFQVSFSRALLHAIKADS